MKIVFDENMPRPLARALNALFLDKHEICHIRDHFPASTQDVEWISYFSGLGGWVVISADRRIRENRLEIEAFKRSTLIGFFLSKALYMRPMEEQMRRLLDLWAPMGAAVKTAKPGSMFELPMASNKIKAL